MLEVQKYLKNHSLEDLQDEFGIVVTDYPDRVVLNYSMIESPKFHPICDECRALILSKPDFNVLSVSFKRFYNYGEDRNSENFNINKSFCLEKCDGCVDYNTEIKTLEYGKQKIGYIVDNKIECHVKSYDIEKNIISYEKILNFFSKDDDEEWYEIETESGEKLEITENHRIYLPDIGCYRKVKDLIGNERVLIL